MSDYETMQNMLVGAPVAEPLYKDKQPKILNDINNQSYNSGQINYDTRDLVQEWICVRDNYIVVPLTIGLNGVLSATNNLGTVTLQTAATTANIPGGVSPATTATFTAGVLGVLAPPVTYNSTGTVTSGSIAFKQSVLDLISGVTVATGDQTQILSELNAPKLVNNIRLNVENSLEWANTYAKQMMYAKDASNTANIATNSGFATRALYLLNTANYVYYPLATGTTAYISSIQVLVNIPLRFIHSFFDNYDFPSKGIRWLINFYLCKELNPSSYYSGFMYDSTLVSSAPTYYIGPTGSALGAPKINGWTYNNSIMRYSTITLPNVFQQKVSELSLQGAINTKFVKFCVTEIYNGSGLLGVTSPPQSTVVTTGIVKPVRLWLFACPSGNLVSSTSGNQTNVQLGSLNVRINNTNRFTQTLINPYDMWSQVTDQMQCLGWSNDKGALISFDDFFVNNATSTAPIQVNGNYAIYCIELDYIQERTDDQAVSIIIDSLLPAGSTIPSSDFVILIEREMTVRMQFDNNRCDIAVGSNV